MVRLIESAFSVLDKKELFIIENHLINHETWIATEKLMQDYFGLEYYRSDRTLKRMQNRALEKMVIFIKEVSDSWFLLLLKQIQLKMINTFLEVLSTLHYLEKGK